MGYFNKEDLKLIKIGIKNYGKAFYKDINFDENEYFKTYVTFLKKSEETRRLMYFINADHDKIKWKNKKGVNMSKMEITAYVFGRDSYIVARAIGEGRKVGLSEFGFIEIDGKELLKPDEQSPFVTDDFADFEEDEVALPSIEGRYYKD